MMSETTMVLRAGTKYRVVYTIDGGRTYYQSTGKLLHVEDDMIYLDLKPAAGVAKISKHNLSKIEAVKSDTPGVRNVRWRGPTDSEQKGRKS